MLKFTFVLTTNNRVFAVQVEDRNLGSATRTAVQKLMLQEGPGQYDVLFVCDGWPKQYPPLMAQESAK